ncbi:OmpA family protein [Nocardiopsis sp. FR4]|uniref:OmpA family protein n=1 Tax=Nocardiopsis sp. FR4 TaxID=2605985 RepID=UPI001356CBF7|nr:OmpA family protein [Nocardiopsis sp. FR4]
MTVVLLLGPPWVATRLEWPLGEHTTWVWLAQYLRGGRVPDEAVIAFFVVVLWAVWAAHLVVVVLDVVSVLRGLAPRVGLVRVVWALVAGSTVATTTHTAAVAAHVDTVAEAPMTPVAAHPEEAAEAGGEQPEEHGVIDRTRVLTGFGFDSAALTPTMKEALEPTIAMIADFGLAETPVVVTGHTDPIGDPLYNQDLSERRAQAVADYLAEHVFEVEFEARGVGSAQPPSATRASYEEHRRVEVTYALQRPSAPVPEPSVKAEAKENPEAAPAPERVRLDVATTGEGTGLDVVAVGTVAGAVGLGVGYAAGRRRSPAAPQKQSTDPESTTGPDDLGTASTLEAPDSGQADLLYEVPAGSAHDVIDEAGYVLVSDTARVSSRGGLAFTGAHASRVLAAVVAEHAPGPVVLTSTAAAFLEEEGVPMQGPQVASDLRGVQIAVEAELLARARHLDADDEGPEGITTTAPPLLVALTADDLNADRGLPALLADTPGLVACVLGGTDHAKVTLDCENTGRVHVGASGGEATHTGPLRLWTRPRGQDEQPDTSPCQESSYTSEPSSEQKEPDQSEEGRPEEDQPEGEQLEVPGCSGEKARARVRVRLFAPQTVCELNGHDVLHGTRTSTYTLLAVLALGPREGVSHQEVTNVLAPQMSETQARRFRSNAVTTLRRAMRDALDLGPEAPIVENEKGRYRLQWEFFDIDVREFCGLYADVRTASTPEGEVKLRKMASLYGNDLLSDLQDEWIAERRWELQAAVADVYMRLLDYVDDEEERIRLIDCALRVDRLNEALYQEKMKHYALLGRKDAVHRCFHSLKDELQQSGAKPGPDSRALFESLVR